MESMPPRAPHEIQFHAILEAAGAVPNRDRLSPLTPDFRKRRRQAVNEAFGLTDAFGPIFAVVSRLTTQKGMDVLAALTDELVAMGGRLALLGSGDTKLETAFIAASNKHRGKIGVTIGYDEALSHLLQGGADAILMPSRFEPCGLTQLYGLRYGSLPVVRRTGGLADTVVDATATSIADRSATGFVFDDPTADDLTAALNRALSLYREPLIWRRLQLQAMAQDFSWNSSARQYVTLYSAASGLPVDLGAQGTAATFAAQQTARQAAQ